MKIKRLLFLIMLCLFCFPSIANADKDFKHCYYQFSSDIFKTYNVYALTMYNDGSCSGGWVHQIEDQSGGHPRNPSNLDENDVKKLMEDKKCPSIVAYRKGTLPVNARYVKAYITQENAEKSKEDLKNNYKYVEIQYGDNSTSKHPDRAPTLGEEIQKKYDDLDDGYEINNYEDTYIGENACNDNNIKKALRFVGYLLLLIKLFIPLLIVGFGIFDLYKAVINTDEFSKQVKMLGYRVCIGLFVFFAPALLNALLIQIEGYSGAVEEYKVCRECVLDPGECEIEE